MGKERWSALCTCTLLVPMKLSVDGDKEARRDMDRVLDDGDRSNLNILSPQGFFQPQ